MKRPRTSLAMTSVAVATLSAVCIWQFTRRPDSPTVTIPTPTPRSVTTGQSAATPLRPAAMADATTYAANRLHDIKQAPEQWDKPEAWQQEFTLAGIPELQKEVLGLARQVGTGPLLAILPQALASDDLLLRLDAAKSIANLSQSDFVAGVSAGIATKHADIRKEVMDIVAQASPEARFSVLQKTLNGPYPDVQLRSIEIITDNPSPEAFSILVEGLLASDPEVHSAASKAIEQLVHQHFNTYQQAAQWWTSNRDRYDAMLLETH